MRVVVRDHSADEGWTHAEGQRGYEVEKWGFFWMLIFLLLSDTRRTLLRSSLASEPTLTPTQARQGLLRRRAGMGR